ncbi:hypothetical protein Angca_002797, partial [Angiostrongylus cantonensis]
WGEGSIGESTVRTWFRKFRSDNFDLEDKVGRRFLNELDADQLKALVEANRRTTAGELAEHLRVNTETIHTYLKRSTKAKELD